MKHYDHYVPIILAALTVLLLGWWNPVALQSTSLSSASSGVINSSGSPTGHPSSLWLSLFALLVGLLSVWTYNQGKR